MTRLGEQLQNWRRRSAGFVRRQLPYLAVLCLLTAFLAVACWNRMVVSIHSGQAGVLWRRLGGGTIIHTIYREGIHVILPFNKMYVYDLRKQLINDNIDVLTVDGLTVHVEYSVRYFPNEELLPLLHQKVGPNYLEVVVRPEVRSVIRTVFGQYKPEEIYTSQKDIQERITVLSKVLMESRFISIDNVPIERITLPASIAHAIESKLAVQQLDAEYVFRLSVAAKEARRKLIDGQGQKDYNDTVNASLTPSVLQWQGILATQELAKSSNAKVVIVGSGKGGLPLILGKD